VKTLNKKEGIKKFDQFWEEMEEEWFKVEVLQDYSGIDSGPSLDAWKAGDKDKSIGLLKAKGADIDEWIEMSKKKSHVNRTRIHVVERPLSQYLEWEIEHYRNINIPLIGEKVYLVEKSDVLDLDIPDGDFMVWDMKRVTKNTYKPGGEVTHFDVYEEGEDISHFLKLREQLVKVAKPIS